MVKLAIICEGKTERHFAEQLLAPHLSPFGVEVQAIEVGVDCKQPGGNVSFDRIVHDLELLLPTFDKVTTLVDYFRLGKGWSGLAAVTPTMSSSEQAETVERAALYDAIARLPNLDIAHRFIPNVLMHEFEGLLFTDPAAIVEITHTRSATDALVRVTEEFASPEDINTGKATAPSKRLENLRANYGKIAHGARIAALIGISAMRKACPHFDAWLYRLESEDLTIGA